MTSPFSRLPSGVAIARGPRRRMASDRARNAATLISPGAIAQSSIPARRAGPMRAMSPRIMRTRCRSGALRVGVAERPRLALDLRQAPRMPLDSARLFALIILAADILAADRSLGFLTRQRLIFEQGSGEQMQLVDMVGENLARGLLAFLDKTADLGVDQPGGLFGHVLRARHAVAKEDLVLIVAIAQPAELFGHAILHDHRARHVG